METEIFWIVVEKSSYLNLHSNVISYNNKVSCEGFSVLTGCSYYI